MKRTKWVVGRKGWAGRGDGREKVTDVGVERGEGVEK